MHLNYLRFKKRILSLAVGVVALQEVCLQGTFRIYVNYALSVFLFCFFNLEVEHYDKRRWFQIV